MEEVIVKRKVLIKSPFVVAVISGIALLFILFSLASFLTNSSNANALDTSSSLELNTDAIIHA